MGVRGIRQEGLAQVSTLESQGLDDRLPRGVQVNPKNAGVVQQRRTCMREVLGFTNRKRRRGLCSPPQGRSCCGLP